MKLTSLQTLFGTQTFYLTADHSLEVSDQVWILFAVAIPLTVVTMAYWLLGKRESERQWGPTTAPDVTSLDGSDLEKDAQRASTGERMPYK
jgi:hypothetical protein